MHYKKWQGAFITINLFVFLLPFLSWGQVRVPFTPRTSSIPPYANQQVYHIKGDFTIIGNKNLTHSDPEVENNYGEMVYIDVDGHQTTVNSSSATLQFSTENNAVPECSNIVFAGLYWTGRSHDQPSPNTFEVINSQTNENVTLDKGVVKLTHENASHYTIIQASHGNYSQNIYYPISSDGYMFSAFADVTAYVQQYGTGEYTVADIALNQGNGGGVGFYGGWGMVVVYENSRMKWRDISIFDGHAYIFAVNQGQETSEILDVSGFQAVQYGQVNVKLGMMAGEGDLGIAGDFFDIRNANNTQWVRLSHGGNQLYNFFNSSIYTGNNPRNPNHTNNYGLDISMFEIPNFNNNIIANNQTSTSFRYGTSQDTYVIFFIAMAVDAYVPDIEPMHQVTTLNGIPIAPFGILEIEPGQEIEFSLEIRNRETEPINDFEVRIPLHYTTEFVEASAQFFYGLTGSQPFFDITEGPTGTITWEVGNLPLPDNPDDLLASLTYKLRVTEDCYILTNANCEPEVSLQGTMSGVGQVSQIPFSNQPFIQGYIDGGDCEDEPITSPLKISINRQSFIDINCTPVDDYLFKNFNYCRQGEPNIPFSFISNEFINGTRFYSGIDEVTGNPLPLSFQFTEENTFPASPGQTTYYAIPPGETDCWWSFSITVFDTSVSNTGTNTYCYLQEVNLTHSVSGILAVELQSGLPNDISLSHTGETITLSGVPEIPGEYNYSITMSTPCENIPELVATGTIVVQSPVEAGQIDPDQILCPGITPAPINSIVNGSGSGLISYFWETSTENETEGFSIIPGATAANFNPGPLTNTTWFRRTTISTVNNLACLSETTDATSISFYEPMSITNVRVNHVHCKREDQGGSINFDLEGDVELPLLYTWNNGSENFPLEGVPSDNYSVIITNGHGCIISEDFFIDYLDEDCIVFIPGGFSPNNDSKNDTWVIRNLTEEHPNNIVKVFNRHGTLIFEASPYEFPWNGEPSQVNAAVGNSGKVPPGVYFYMIWFDQESKPITGSVFVSY